MSEEKRLPRDPAPAEESVVAKRMRTYLKQINRRDHRVRGFIQLVQEAALRKKAKE